VISRSSCIATAVALSLTIPLAAADSRSDRQELTEELKSDQDPTLLARRMWLDTEWNRFKDSSNDVDLTVGRLWAWRLSEHLDWGLRLKVPLRSHWAGDTAGDSNEYGLGDIKAAAGMAARLSESWRVAGGLEMRFPTANDGLGANAWRPQLFGTVAWDVTPTITLSPSAEYNKSIKELRGSASQEFLELFFPATFVLPDYWAITPRYEYKVDFANNDQVTRSAKLTLSKRLRNSPFGFALSFKKPIDETEKRFQVNFVTTYYFPPVRSALPE